MKCHGIDMRNPWIKVTDRLPEISETVETKIDDNCGVRNEQEMKLYRNLWWHTDMSVYVYYTPTHWRKV